MSFRPFWIAVALAVCTAGGLWLVHRYHPAGMTLQSQLDPVAVVALAVTVFIAYFVQHYLGRRAEDSRVEKDLLIEALREAQSALRDVRESFRFGPADRAKHVFLLRQLANRLYDVQVAVNESRYSKLAESVARVRQAYYRFKGDMTGMAPLKGAPGPETLTKLMDAYAELNRELQRLIFTTNKQGL